ncbi:hypothetical protein IMSAGC006_02290 [Muribaculaceae bacterium]|nr:hypothetical protein IMSAGC006_02290 [Muribaculaceae bacterium]
MNGLQVFGRHDVFVFNIQFFSCLAVTYGIGPAAYLGACSSVCRTVKFMQAEVAFAGYGHAEGTVTKHFDFYRFSCRSGNVFVYYGLMYGIYLLHGELACEHYGVGPLGVEFDRFNIRDIGLGGYVHFHAYRPCI